MSMPLYLSSTMEASVHDFGAMVANDHVTVPRSVWAALQRLSIRNVDQFVNVLYEAPGEVAAQLSWPMPTVVCARERLVRQLDGKVESTLLHPLPPMEVSFGALPPPHFVKMK